VSYGSYTTVLLWTVKRLGHDVIMVMANGEAAQAAVLQPLQGTDADVAPLQRWMQPLLNPDAQGFAAPHPMNGVGFRGGYAKGSTKKATASRNAQIVADSVTAAFQRHVTGTTIFVALLRNIAADDSLWRQGTAHTYSFVDLNCFYAVGQLAC
jgi:hypothetical protein